MLAILDIESKKPIVKIKGSELKQHALQVAVPSVAP